MEDEVTQLRQENARLRAEIAELRGSQGKTSTAAADPHIHPQSRSNLSARLVQDHDTPQLQQSSQKEEKDNKRPPFERLTNPQIAKYSRQLLIPEVGVKGQLKLVNASVLVVGAGGLGAPAALYLAAAGVGRLGIIDYDVVESSNLQRQIIHDESKIDVPKAVSAKMTIEKLNSLTECIAYNTIIDRSNVLELIEPHDVVLDATDNAATRYLLNDACVLANKVLVSGSALRMDGQLTVYNYQNGPCYRCVFPKPPPAETVVNCSDGGVLGVVTGVIGCMQALEAIKIIAGIGPSYSQKLLIFDALQGTFRAFKLRGRRDDCVVCGTQPVSGKVTVETLKTGLMDYVAFCGAAATDKTMSLKVLPLEDRISCREYAEICNSATPHVLLDVRDRAQFDICSLPGSINIPLNQLETRLNEVEDQIEALRTGAGAGAGASASLGTDEEPDIPIYVVCRLGNYSQLAVQTLREKWSRTDGRPHCRLIKDIIGGVTAWAEEVDTTFPVY